MTRYSRLFALLVIIALGLLFFWKLAFTDMILARGDTYTYFAPYWDVRNAAFRAGELPLWTPDIFMGAPLLANPQLGTFYPLNWLTAPFAAPDALRLSILLHIIIAGMGTFVLFRAVVSQRILPALVAALIFMGGGYLGAHVEQINQLQGMAWLPWLFWLYHQTMVKRWTWALGLAGVWALQIFTGHTQTVFISGVGLGLYALAQPLPTFAPSRIMRNWLRLLMAAVLALLLALPQILPTLELTGMSNRGSGLNTQQAVSFSLPPWYLPRSLLGIYDGQLFGEYIVTLGVVALFLLLLGLLTPSENRLRWTWLIIGGIGLFFAIGAFNPVYWLLSALPGFNLFRVPARWSALFALAAALLAGRGLLMLQLQHVKRRHIVIAAGVIAVLIALAGVLPLQEIDISGGVVANGETLARWLALLVATLALVLWRTSGQARQTTTDDRLQPHEEFRARRQPLPSERLADSLPTVMPLLLALLLVVELWLASQSQPYNDLAPSEVYTGQRFTISQMLAYNAERTPPSRMLAISNLYFDTGDLDFLQRRYQQLDLSADAQATALVATKKQEMLMPNLPLTWGIASMDGFGGGVLPTIYYSQFTSLLLPPNTLRTVDGRMGEILAREACRGACIPASRWLELMDTRYILTDKTYDIWHEDIAYDTTFHQMLTDTSIVYDNETHFTATQINVLFGGETTPQVADYDSPNIVRVDDDFSIAEFTLDDVQAPDTVTIVADNAVYVLAVTLVDTRTGDFVQLSPDAWSRRLSSDIKLHAYQPTNDESLRVRLATDVDASMIFADDWQGHEDALDWLETCDNSCVALHGAEPLPNPVADNSGTVEFVSYTSTRVELSVTSEHEAYLYLADAYYPAWQATVNDTETPVYRANVMFRAVRIPAGTSQVVFEFVPTLWYGALASGAVLWGLLLLGGVVVWWKTS